MMIDIDRLTEAELVDLNNRIVERLRFLHQIRVGSETTVVRDQALWERIRRGVGHGA